MSPHYLVKIAQILHLFHFLRVSSRPTNSPYERVAERQRLVAIRAELQQSMVDDTVEQWQKRLKACVSVQKVVSLNICCNVACLTFHLPHITTMGVASNRQEEAIASCCNL